jgi:hypothetical protein
VFWFCLSVVDVGFIGLLLWGFCQWLFGEKPLARLLRLLVTIGGAGGYFLLFWYVMGSTEISFFWGLLVAFAPAAFLVILLILYYMFKSDSGKK